MATGPDPQALDARAVRRAFGRAAASYDAAAALQREIGGRLAERLDVVRLAPSVVLDAGCGTGYALGELAARYPAARLVALDAAGPMVEAARARWQRGRSLLARVLGPLARAFAGVDGHTHVSRFVDMHDLGDMLVHAGFADPVMDMELITLTYPTPAALLDELKAIGATNQTRGRPRGLTGRRRRQALDAALASFARDGRIPATFEVVYGHAWKVEPSRTAEGLPVVKMHKAEKRR